MAYLAFTELPAGPALPATMPAPSRKPPSLRVAAARLSALEWTVVALAAHDGVASLRQPGRFAKWIGKMFGRARSMALADPRLEALRRIAVLSWQHGYTVPGHEVRRFLDAGFSADQYELLVDRISTERGTQQRRRAA